MNELAVLTESRKYKRKLVTERHKKKDTFHSLSNDDKYKIKSSLLDCQSELKSLNSKIQILKWSKECKDDLADELESCEQYNQKILDCICLLQGQSSNPSPAQFVPLHTPLKSPVAPLPTYSGNADEDVNKFFLQFEQTIDKFNYSDYDKLLILKQQLSGRAKILVDSLEVANQAYDKAKSLLEEALASKETKIYNALKQLSQIRMSVDEDPFNFVAKMKNITEGFETLKITTNHVLQYFFWKGLPFKFQDILVQITNNSKPTLDEINSKFFEACNRYSNLRVKRDFKQPEKAIAGFAADIRNVNRKFIPCSLCLKMEGKTDHPIYLCKKYESPQSKIEQLKRLNGCLNCANFGHQTKHCQYKPRNPCKHCSSRHLTFLCNRFERTGDSNRPYDNKSTSSSSGTNSKEKVNKKPFEKKVDNASCSPTETSSSNAVTEITIMKSEFDDHTILPTFVCTLNDTRIRVLKDGGAQSNFVSEDLADRCNLKTLKSVTLLVNGINGSKKYNTRLVEADLNLDGVKVSLHALCLPQININLHLPELEYVANTFKQKGYILADPDLIGSGNQLGNVDFILGSKSSFCIPEREILFGSNPPSVYSESSIGILLKGDMNDLCRNLAFLPEVVQVQHSALLSASEVAFGRSREGEYVTSGVEVCEEVTALLCSNFEYDILDLEGNLVESELQRATDNVLDESYRYLVGCDERDSVEDNELNKKLVNHVITNTERLPNGRLQMPLLWNPKVAHKLGRNFNLAKKVLSSVFNKLKNDETKLSLMEDTFREQERLGIIEKIHDVDKFMEEHPSCSFLPFMGVYKLKRETTKCRVVFLSNICERVSRGCVVSHNQAIHAGPSLNQKLASSILHLRFGEFLLCFDLERAFNQIQLSEMDQNRLLFLWYKDIHNGDFSLVAYKNIRLSFGLRCSPTLLMLSLYLILVEYSESESSERVKSLKRNLYQLAYMDNLAVTTNSLEDLNWATSQLEPIFNPYGFSIQQFLTNSMELQDTLDSRCSRETPTTSKLLGLMWNRSSDTLFTNPISLNLKAKTKREILSSIASQYDVFGYNSPILLRSRLFMHGLQCRRDLGWDVGLDDEDIREWGNIVRQANSSQPIEISRCVGNREDPYNLIAFADASQSAYGIVIYLQNLRTKNVSFVASKSRIVNKNLEKKTIPALELQALSFAAECLIDLYEDLSGGSCLLPVNVEGLLAYSDSLVALNWVKSYISLDKMQKKTTFVQNRLKDISENCEKHEITFKFVAGIENPADFVTRPVSHKQLAKTCYVSGPKFLWDEFDTFVRFDDSLTITVPNPKIQECHSSYNTTSKTFVETQQIIDLETFSSGSNVFRIMELVLIAVNQFKLKLQKKKPSKVLNILPENHNFYEDAATYVIKHDQKEHFPELFTYFELKEKRLKDIPSLLNQLNLYQDRLGIVRVKNKLGKMAQTKIHALVNFPILLAKKSRLAYLLILDAHERLAHAGCYTILSELRKQFWITCMFSLVKRVIKQCVICKRFNARTIKLNQSPYREIRLDPDQIPFRNIYLDFMGPFTVKECEKDKKVWVLIVTCMWSRAVSMKVCPDLSVREFLLAFQKHCLEFGVPSYCVSDLGTQLVAGANVIKSFLDDYESKEYFNSHGIKGISFFQYPKGHSQLGSMVETCVKLTKKLMFGAMGKNKLKLEEFEFIVCQTIHLVNRRPVAFKSALRNSMDDVPEPITPEKLIKGYELISVNMIPFLQASEEEAYDPSRSTNDHIKSSYKQLSRVRESIIRKYNEEFLSNLIYQAVDNKDRYKPVKHQLIEPGDIVLIKDPFTKPSDYPMAVVKTTVKNTSNEVTEAVVMKGKTRELLRRHSSTLIPLLSLKKGDETGGEDKNEISQLPERRVSKRKAAIKSGERTRDILVHS